MLSGKRRVNKALFPLILKKGRSFHSHNMSLKVLDTNDRDRESKFAFVVSRKVAGKAHKRNLLRRRGYGAIGKILDPIRKGFVCAFFLRKGANDLSYAQFEAEIIGLLKKANII
ncbi:MAG: hypothetical protein BMS9Abin13_459 [Patescibacteria group bacterium]|nr:MAG: hypothetical protein BMS9Abin13_459 [Patescibacteria group bacterium]